MEEQNPVQNDSNSNSPIPSPTEEVTSTTPVVEVTKRSLRVQTWRKIQDNSAAVVSNGIFNRIPDFIGNDKAAALLAETDEFKKSNKIKVNIDRALNAVKLQVLAAGKELYLPGTRESKALYLKVECPPDATEDERKSIIHVQDIQKSRTEILLENKVKFDLVVIGSCLVSRDGSRIGRGNGFADLDIGLLIEIGSVTPETVIATIVHDLQVADSNLPTNLFQKYDTPVDLIVTPTEVIRVEKPLPRPTGLFWEILSERRLKIIPVLQVLKENEEKAGKIITLKEENTDVESSAHRHYQRRRRQYGPSARRSETQNERPRRKKQTGGRRPRSNKSKSEASATEDNKEDALQKQKKREQKENRARRRRQGKPSNAKDRYCVKVTNIPKGIRVRDLKTELKKREVNPLYIAWKGQFGKCYLHFPTPVVTNKDEEVNNVMKSLSELSITVGEQNETCILTTELIKFNAKAELARQDEAVLASHSLQRIESVDTTTSKSEASAEDHKEKAALKQIKDGLKDKRSRRRRLGKPTSSPKERFCVKVTNIPKFIRVRDLKIELRKREVKPLYITWNGKFGKCYLHFSKLGVSTEADDDVSSVLKSLSELSITTDEQNEACVLTTELIKFDEKAESARQDKVVLESNSSQRIESVDTTTV